MKQPHIRLDESLNVRYAILPGDPRRAERIASHMSEVEDLGMNREYRSLVGTYRGARILAMSTGMGGVAPGPGGAGRAKNRGAAPRPHLPGGVARRDP